MNSLELKKKAIMSLMSQPQGTERSVEGDNQIVLSDCVDENSLTSIKLFGKTEDVPVYDESGNVIPKSPDNPYELKSIESPTITVRGKNLLDKDNLIGTGSKFTKEITNTGFTIIGGDYVAIKAYDITDVVKPNTTYYFHRELLRYTTNGESWEINESTPYSICGYAVIKIDGVEVKALHGFMTDLSFTVPSEFSSVAITTYGVWTKDAPSSVCCIEWKNVCLSTEPYDFYEPYYEPKTITLPDVTLRGVRVEPNSDVVPVSYISDSKKYMADELYIEDGRVYHKVQIAERSYNKKDKFYTNSGIWSILQNYGVLATSTGIFGNGVSLKTYITIDGKHCIYGYIGINSTHFPITNMINFYTPIANNYTLCTGGVPGDYAGYIFLYVPQSTLGEGLTIEELPVKMKEYVAELNPVFIGLVGETITDITDTEVGKALLGIGTHKGTTVIETNGHLSASYLSNTEE